MKPAAFTAILLLSVIALAHAVRFVFGVPIIAGDTEFPLWASAVGAVLIGALAAWLWRESS